MAMFTKQSLEQLRQRIDLVEVLSSHLELKPAGACYKTTCPFHDEKTPSFMVQKGDKHYHCFGCDAHGDAIQFLIDYQKVSFSDAVELLAQQFHVPLQRLEKQEEEKGPKRASLKACLEATNALFQFLLLHTDEGHQALKYLYERGIDLEFIQKSGIGWAPKDSGMVRKFLYKKGFNDEVLLNSGIIARRQSGVGFRDFFFDRITFPIHDSFGSVVGFSARKYKEETFGGKYVNTSETPLFKKSRLLYGLYLSRRRIAKERRALIVEGQIDALRLIHHGLNITVAGQGTAFGETHAKELLNLGVNHVYLAFDPDLAGQEAVEKVGHFFQREGVEVTVVLFPNGADPDSIILEQGISKFLLLLEKGEEYLSFLVRKYGKSLNRNSPAGKSELVQKITKRIRDWKDPLMIHESLRRLAHLAQVPEEIVGVGREHIPNIYVAKSDTVGEQIVNPDLILEGDFLVWFLLLGQTQLNFFELAKKNITEADFRVPVCKKIYQALINLYDNNQEIDLLSLAIELNDDEAQKFIDVLLKKRINKDRAEVVLKNTIFKMLNRNWMEKREKIRVKIHSGKCSEVEAMDLLKTFQELQSSPPELTLV